ncbi:MAG TPA: ankyrin repeat domain-containing protein [Burkholderiales bacterium]|nr:ankyrin repeat domain-containing protein [Burkholderiales bacterium]
MKNLLSLVLGACIAWTVNAAPSDTEKLLKAAEAGDTARIEALLAAGVDVDGRDKRGFTPLMYAAANDRVPAIELLIRRDADVNAQSDIGETALICAVRYGRGKPETLKALIDAGANVNVAMKDGGSALSWARKKNRSEAVALLAQAGAR